jgi:hypothetical protein
MDKLTRYFTAGLIGGIVKDLPVFITHIIWDIPKIAYWDYAARIGFGKDNINTIFDYIFAISIEVLFGAAIGMAYSYIVEYLKPKHYLLSGAYLGISTWFMLRTFMVLYKIPPFERPDMISAIINFSLSILFGFTVTYANNYLKKKEKRTFF